VLVEAPGVALRSSRDLPGERSEQSRESETADTLVEAPGVEPGSESASNRASTRVVGDLCAANVEHQHPTSAVSHPLFRRESDDTPRTEPDYFGPGSPQAAADRTVVV
jgi:hypothetical protein